MKKRIINSFLLSTLLTLSIAFSILFASGCGREKEESQNAAEKEIGILETDEKRTKEETEEEKETQAISDDYTGIALKDNKMCYYTKGIIDNNYTGLSEYENQWWYVNNGLVDYNYVGVAYKDDGMWYVNNGTIDTKYSGKADFLDNTLNVTNGCINSEFSVLKADNSVIDVPKSEVSLVYNYSEHIYSDPQSPDAQTKFSIWDNEFTTKEKGLYRIVSAHIVEDNNWRSWLKFEYSILDKYRNELGKRTGELSDTQGDIWVKTLLLNGNDKYIFSDARKRYSRADDNNIGWLTIYVLLMKPYIDISGATVINDTFNEDIFSGIGDIDSDKTYSFASYDYTPDETGDYTIWFDNIEISKGKELYSENNLFNVGIINGDNVISSKKIYVNGNDTQVQSYLEVGKTYQIKLAVKNQVNSEVYHNGDVSFSMHIGHEEPISDITGYISISDHIDYAGQEKTYTVTPCRKQTIQYTLSKMREGAKVNVEIHDNSGNVINSYNELGNESKFELKDAMKDNKYTVVIDGKEVTDYVLSVTYN